MDTLEEENSLTPVKGFLLTYLMPEICYDNFFVNFNFMHVPCLKIVLSKTVGLWILLEIVIAPPAQVLKIIKGRNADGLSLTSVLLQLYAGSGPVLFLMAKDFPLSAWGERLFMLIQTALIGFLILHYRGHTLKGVLLISAYGVAMLLLGSPTSPTAVLSTLQDSSVAAVIASKTIQAGTNYSNGHTGQLSSLSVFLAWAGSAALIFVSLQNTGKSLTTLAHILSACLSCILLVQVVCCRNNSPSMKQKMGHIFQRGNVKKEK